MIRVTEVRKVDSIGDVISFSEFPKAKDFDIRVDGGATIFTDNGNKPNDVYAYYPAGSYLKVEVL